MDRKDPPWLEQTREFCRNSGIKIVGWGPDMLTVEAKSEECVQEIASQIGQLGFRIVKNDDDAYAGLLNLSRNPAAVEAKIASFDIWRRPWDDQIEPLIWALGALLLLPGLAMNGGRYPDWVTLPLGALSSVLFFWDGGRIWGWRVEPSRVASSTASISMDKNPVGADPGCDIEAKGRPRVRGC
jgi:hypothetical protein